MSYPPARSEDCCCPRWQATQCGPDGVAEDYCCPDGSCRCPVHCWDEDHDRPMWDDEDLAYRYAEAELAGVDREILGGGL